MKITAGTRTRFTLTYRGASGTPADPTVATVRVQRPDGTRTDIAASPATPPATGIRICDITFDQPGTWRIMPIGTGTVTATDVITVTVTPALAAP